MTEKFLDPIKFLKDVQKIMKINENIEISVTFRNDSAKNLDLFFRNTYKIEAKNSKNIHFFFQIFALPSLGHSYVSISHQKLNFHSPPPFYNKNILKGLAPLPSQTKSPNSAYV